MQELGLVLFVTGFIILGSIFGVAALVTRRSRALPEDVVSQIREMEPVRPNQHLVDLEFRDGTVVPHVYIAWGRYPALGSIRRLWRHRSADVVAARPASR
jgi:hypothetical protein